MTDLDEIKARSELLESETWGFVRGDGPLWTFSGSSDLAMALSEMPDDVTDLLAALDAANAEAAAARDMVVQLEGVIDTVLTRDGHFTFCTGGAEPEHGCMPTCVALRAALAGGAGPESDVAGSETTGGA